METATSFGPWLKQRRKALDLTQAELAAAVGCAMMTIQKIEAEERRPSKPMAQRLATVLAMTTDQQPAFVAWARGEHCADPTPALPAALRPSGGMDRPGERLPIALTSFIGRAHEVAATIALLRRPDVRLVTLTGPGGVGKTRLALEVATTLVDHFADGVGFVPLASVVDPALVIPTVAQALGVAESPGQPLLARLTAQLRARQLLLVLDNFEHLSAAAASVTALVAAAPQLKVLVTSRASLRVYGEQEFSVPPLTLPILHRAPALAELSQSEAVQLFVARAQAVSPTFAVTDERAATVAAICHHVDGLPLAIELAAARLKLFAPAALLDRLRSRLALLADGPRDVPPRHQTMRAAIAWSYDLLDEAEQTVFRRLGVFVGGWTLPAAEAVCGVGVVDGLAALVDQSLVQPVAAGDEPRFTMLETIREYALERLAASGEAARTQQRHAHYYLAYAEQHHARSNGAVSEVASDIHREYDNAWAALAWSQTTAGDAELALRLANVSTGLWCTGQKGIAALQRSLEHPHGIGRTKAHACARIQLAGLLGGMGSYADSEQQYELALELALELRETAYQAEIFHSLGWVAREQGHTARAWTLFSDALALFRSLGDTGWIIDTLTSMAEVAVIEEDPLRAEALLEQSAEVAAGAEVSDIPKGWICNHRGHAAQLRGEFERAMGHHQESLTYFGEDFIAALVEAYQCLGECALGLGRTAEGVDWLAHGLKLSRVVSHASGTAWCLAGFGTAAALDKQPQRAARLWGAAERLRETIGCRSAPATRLTYERAVGAARARHGDAAFAAAWAAGRALTLEQAVAEALETRDGGTTEAAGAGTEGSAIRSPSARPATLLTAREVDVVRVVAEGVTDQEVARRLGVRPRTVTTYLTSIYAKLAVRTRTAAVRVAREQELI